MIDFFYEFLESFGYYHPVHSAIVHLPIGTVAAAFTFSMIGFFSNKQRMALAAYYSTVFAFVSLFFSVFFGITDWQHYFASAWLFPIKAKMILASVLFIVLLLGTLLRYREPMPRKIYIAHFALAFLSFVVIIALGYFGANLVYSLRGAPATTTQLQAGERVFRLNCAACHPQGGNIIDPSLPLQGAPELTDFDTFLNYIRYPVTRTGLTGSMPAFPPSKISNEQAKALYLYVTQSLRSQPGLQKELK